MKRFQSLAPMLCCIALALPLASHAGIFVKTDPDDPSKRTGMVIDVISQKTLVVDGMPYDISGGATVHDSNGKTLPLSAVSKGAMVTIRVANSGNGEKVSEIWLLPK